MVGTRSVVSESLRVELELLAGSPIDALITSDAHRVVTIDAEILALVATATIRIALTCGNGVGKDPVIRMNLQWLRDTVVTIQAVFRRMAVLTTRIIRLGYVGVIGEPLLVMRIAEVPSLRRQVSTR